MFDDVNRLKSRYAQQIEDGRKMDVITTMPEWIWFVEHVLQPTIEEYTHRIMSGQILSDKEDWILRGMVAGMQMVVDSTSGIQHNASEAKKKVKALQEGLNDE